MVPTVISGATDYCVYGHVGHLLILESNKASGFTCTVDVINNGEPGSGGFFRIQVSNGYDRGATLGSGNIKIHK